MTIQELVTSESSPLHTDYKECVRNALCLRAGRPAFYSWHGQGLFSSSSCSDRLWGPSRPNGYRGLLPGKAPGSWSWSL